MTPDDKTPVDQALDLFVYAPVGLALVAREMLPELVRKGRERVTGQVATAKMMGQFAVQQGQTEATKLIKKVQAPAATRSAPDGGEGPTTAPAPAQPAATTTAPPVNTGNGTGPATRVQASALAVPDYDSLSASQVVPRLAGLSPAELEAVRLYEATHRGRKTILNKISQIQAAG